MRGTVRARAIARVSARRRARARPSARARTDNFLSHGGETKSVWGALSSASSERGQKGLLLSDSS